MNSWFGVVFLILMLLLIYYLIGIVFCDVLSRGGSKNKVGWICCVYGFLVCQALFSIIEIPMACYEQSLSSVVLVWGIVLSALVFISIVYIIKKKKCLSLTNEHKIGDLKDNFSVWIFVFGIVIIQVIIQVLSGNYGSYLDSSTYNGWIMTAIHTDTIFQFNPYTGLVGEVGKTRFLSSYEMYMAVICSITKMHPLIVVNQVMAILEIVFYNIIVFKIFKILFSGNIKNAASAMGFLCIFNLATSSVMASPAGFLFFRAAESKSILANIILPMVILEMCCLYFDEIKGMWWIFLFVILFAGCAIGNSGIFVPPAVAIFGLISLFLVKNKPWKYLLYFPVIFSPNICYLALYFLWR